MNLNKMKNKPKNDMVSINSAALQDHILKTTNLDLGFAKKRPKKILPMIKKLKEQNHNNSNLNQQNTNQNRLDTRNRQAFQQSAQNILRNTQLNQQIQSQYYQQNFQSYENQINQLENIEQLNNEFIQEQQLAYNSFQNNNNYNIPQFQQQQQQQLKRKSNKPPLKQLQKKEPKHIRIGHQKIVLERVSNSRNSERNNREKLEGIKQGKDFEYYIKEQEKLEQKREQYKLQNYYNNLTLAQRLGIVEAPQKPLGQQEWQKIEEQSKKRQDSEGCCAICLEDFKDKDQVLLSCSHVFHKACLQSFEKHNKLKSCPICRKQHYDKKTIDDGFRFYVIKCTIRIQKTWRGNKVRKDFFKDLLDKKYKAESLYLRRKILGFKLMKFGNKMSEALEQKKKETEIFLKEQQQKMEQNKNILEQNLQSLKVQKLQNEQFLQQLMKDYHDSEFNQNEQYIQELQDSVQQKHGIRRQNSSSNKQQQLIKGRPKEEWQQIKLKALDREESDCAICFTALCDHSKKKNLYLLSCTHIFHAHCLDAFERYNLAKKHECPVCRTVYQKVNLTQEQNILQ